MHIMLKRLEEDKAFWVNKEAASSTYVAAINEEPVVPEYDYTEVAATIAALDEKIAIIKQALNVTNATAKVWGGDTEMSIDTILIKMAQLNKRKSVLDQMRKQLPKAREDSPYRIIFCKVLKRDVERFEEALGKLKDKMRLLGHRDYPDACSEIAKMIEEGTKARKGK